MLLTVSILIPILDAMQVVFQILYFDKDFLTR